MPETRVEQEVLLYPWTSLVAELGGLLGLFLGFSFITLWDGLMVSLEAITRLKIAWMNLQLAPLKP